jgi:hypothetical protein
MKTQRIAALFLLASAALAASCSTKSPSEPAGGGGTSTPPPPPSISDNVVVTASPGGIVIGTSQSSNITVRVTQSTGGTVPDGTPVTLTATLGAFGSTSGPTTLVQQTVNGIVGAVLFPGTSAGTATVTAVVAPTASSAGVPANLGGSGSAQVRITAPNAFFLNSVTPNVGNPAGGDKVTITGGGFSAPVRVSFSNAVAQVLSVNPSAITVLTPSASAAGVTVNVGQTATVSISVINALNSANQASDTISSAFTYSLGGTPTQPQVFSVNPAAGPDSGGTTVTILGQGFQAPVQVFFGTGGSSSAFNGVEASVTSVTATKIVCLTPSASGFGQTNVDKTVDILVKDVNSGFSAIAPQSFKYGSGVLITSAAPTITPWNRSVKVTIFGQGFQSPVAVGLAGVAAQVVSVSGTEIDVLSGTPVISSCADLTGPITETNINTGQGASALTFDYQVDKPSIGSITPASVSGNGNSTVTLTGINFDNPVRVLFGAEAGSAQAPVCDVSGSCTVKVTVPPFTGTYPTTPCTSSGVAGTMKTPVSVNVVLTNVLTTCADTLQGAITFIPPDQSCQITATPPKASFSDSVQPGGFEVLFTDSSTGTITSWAWNFGDGSPIVTQQNPNHTFPSTPNPGSYTVMLTVSGPGGSSSTSSFITVPGS